MGFAPSAMQLTSPAFAAGGAIPAKHTGEGEDVSPAFAFSDVPEGTRALALVCHDPDAPLVLSQRYGFVHWVLYNIPAEVRELAEGTDIGTAGPNDFGNTGYGGPMPPEGHGLHQYYFWLFALSREPDLPAGLDLWSFLGEIHDDVIGMNRLVGTYQRD
ncbi:MAG: YbhB/YbcL family Raf kinase inhibitor-like protein [Pseudomonadales bacterium]|jgi:Raf kinase inhibitor-like YbhB/YbcL family protein|nr:YbhB/YbcL family Raf kinase inhibitor-like protein [Pseudomonadales bacterium]